MAPKKKKEKMSLNWEIITYSHQVGLVECCFPFVFKLEQSVDYDISTTAWHSSFEKPPGIEDTKYTWFACGMVW